MWLGFRALRRRRSWPVDSEGLEGVPPVTESDEAIQAYLESFTRRKYTSNSAETAIAISYISYLKEQCKSVPASVFAPAKGFSPRPNALATNTQIFRALAELAPGMKENPQWSVNDGINTLVVAGVFRIDFTSEDIILAAQVVFSMSGWITMLFTPLVPYFGVQPELQVDTTGTRRFLTASQSTMKAERPLVEVLKGFGEILPVRRRETSKFDVGEAKSDTLEVANLNMATLVNIGFIDIIWVKSISSHLEFDSLHQQLSLFCVPSFCKLNLDGNTPCESILNDFYDDDDIPQNPSSGHSLFKEILLSYKLLFADDRYARTIYRKKERERAQAARGTPIDPCLDNLCGLNFPRKLYLSTFRSPLTVSYSKTTDFPLLADRLSELQSYITSRQPNRLTALWHDRRNLVSWYTFWAVLIFGVVGIACSIIQTILAAVQTAIAWKAYQAQLASVPAP